MAAEPQLGAEEESLRKGEPSSLEAVSREERSRAAAAERVAMGERRENGERGEESLSSPPKENGEPMRPDIA